MPWCASITCKCPDFPGSSGQGCDIGGSDKQSEDNREGNIDSRGSSIRKGILEGRGCVYRIFEAANGKKHSDHHCESEGYFLSASARYD